MTTYVPYEDQAQPAQAGAQPQYVPYEEPKAAPVAETKPRTFTENLARQLGLTARAYANTVTYIPRAAADFATGAANLVGARLPNQSEAFNKFLTQLGLPQAETPEEKFAGAAAEMLGSGMGPFNTALPKMFEPSNVPAAFESAKTQLTKTAKELRDAGVKLPPSQTESGTVAKTIEGLSDSSRIAPAMAEKNQVLFQQLARTENKLPRNAPLTMDVLKSQANRLAEEGYRPIEAIPQIKVDNNYRATLRKIVDDLGTNQSFPLADRQAVLNEVKKYYYNPNQPFGNLVHDFTGRDAIKAIQSLRQEADDLMRSEGGDKALAAAKKRIANALENQIETDLTRRGKAGADLIDAFRATREQLAKNYATREMLSDPSTGTIDATKAASAALVSDRHFTGGLATIAKAGSPVFRPATAVPRGETTTLKPWEEYMTMGGIGGAVAGHPGIGGALAALPFARMAGRHAITSNLGQKMLASQGMFGPETAALMQGNLATQAAPYMSLFNPYDMNPTP